MISKIISLNVLFCFVFICLNFVSIPYSDADYDELPDLNNISSMAIYNMMHFSTIPSQDQADYNITDQNRIAQIYAGFNKKTSKMIDKLEAITEGIVYLKLNNNSYKELAIFDNWDYFYVYSEGPSNNIYYKISPDVRTLLLENAHQTSQAQMNQGGLCPQRNPTHCIYQISSGCGSFRTT